MYSWKTTEASSAASAEGNPGCARSLRNSRSVSRGECPSRGVYIDALLKNCTRPSWKRSAPTRVSARTGSPPTPPWPSLFVTWKLPAASVNPMGAASRVVVVAVQQRVRLHGLLIAVRLPAERRLEIPGAGIGRAAVLRGVRRVEGGRVVPRERRGVAGRDLIGGVDPVVGAGRRVDVRVVARERGGIVHGERDGDRHATPVGEGAGRVRPREPRAGLVVRHQVLAPQDGAGAGVDDRSIHLLRGDRRDGLPGQPRDADRGEPDQGRAVGGTRFAATSLASAQGRGDGLVAREARPLPSAARPTW